ncbi:MAG: acyltransferase [Bacteroidales bacterium]|nr:acyltransferase [Bacteroidales bacterium]
MRIKGFDFLRFVAVVLVIYRHSDSIGTLNFIGWVGVDLFFVLSGFLVSGLMFKEYKKTGGVKIKRFLMRRAFKIYPPFYVFFGGYPVVPQLLR